jgi:hypothetical protein
VGICEGKSARRTNGMNGDDGVPRGKKGKNKYNNKII